MGVDQSTLSSAPLKSQRDEDIPYTSCSISKPISSGNVNDVSSDVCKDRQHSWGQSTSLSRHPRPDIDDAAAAAAAADDDDDDADADDVDASRSSPSLASLPAKVVRSAADSRSQRGHIVVVAEGRPSGPVTDTELQRLSSVPAFTPLLHGDPTSSRPPLLDTRHVLALCSRYQDHLHQSADAVAFDQNALCVRIKEVLNVSTSHCVYQAPMFVVVCSVWFVGYWTFPHLIVFTRHRCSLLFVQCGLLVRMKWNEKCDDLKCVQKRT